MSVSAESFSSIRVPRRNGMALVLVLPVLVLLTILVVGFLYRSTTERSAASAYFEGNRNRQFADQAVNIVQAQIDHASTRQNTAWASQPGMVRTFKQDGSLLQAYKLYSDASMVSDAVDAAAAAAALQNWQNSPAHFTDLNEPANGEGRTEFPILDASALDKNASNQSLIEGFEVTNAPNATPRQPVPMPVRWLYVLEDGQTVAPSNSSGTTAVIPGASAANPIIGRIAFWTDDDTCKLNINTAAHGLFWDIPRAFTLDERDRMARFQPALREYQRYPGHPATTSLWPVLGYKAADDKAFGEFVYSLVPRVQNGGSEAGTKFAGAAAVTLDNDRLFVSADELLFSAANGVRQAQPGLDRSDIERTKFFLTARSNSPEVNLFNLPRMAIWPINAGSKAPSTLDKVIAFCATINNQKYYLQRSDANSGTADMQLDGKRNEQLYGYVNALLQKPFPGFGARSFVEKYTAPETAQITTSIFDYIRCSNLYSTALGASAFTGTGVNPLSTNGSRAGQVTPLAIGDTKGFGRIPSISKAVLHLYVSGLQSGAGPTFREFPSAAYPMQTGPLPYYSDNFSTGSYKSLRDFLTDTGVGGNVKVLTSAIIYFDTFDPMLGYAKPRYKFDVEVSFSGNWQVTGASGIPQSLGFQNATLNISRDQNQQLYNSKTNGLAGTYFGRFYGGHLGPLWMMQNYTYVKGNPVNTASSYTKEYPLASARVSVGLPFQLVDENAGTPPVKVTLPPAASSSISFSGGTAVARIMVDGAVVQTYHFDFPGFTKPAPSYPPRGYLSTTSRLPSYTDADLVIKQLAVSADFRNRWAQQPNTHVKNPMVSPSTTRLNALGETPAGSDYCDLWLIQGMDTIVSLEPANGDKRILAARSVLNTGAFGSPGANFVPEKDYATPSANLAVDLRNEPFGLDRRQRAFNTSTKPGRILDILYGGNAMPDIPSRYPAGVKNTTDGAFWPDFDNGTLHTPDDAYVNRADEGSANTSISDGLTGTDTGSRGFSWYGEAAGSENNALFFSPNKQMPSAGVFGSLPTGAIRNKPWQTLLFRPDPGGHPGASGPADYLLLDLFWMPVVEPYAISERFSSNGKVNMNYQIMPFNYLHRSTAIRGVLQKQEMVSIPNSSAVRGAANAATGYGGVRGSVDDEYKLYAQSDSAILLSPNSIRRTLNLSKVNGTLKPFEDVFAANNIFRSETQICSVPLIPSDATWSEDFEEDYWDSRRLTGDNSREMPYAQLLPRLTTRSNTYTVHFRVQTLKKVPSTDPGVWEEGRDKVTAEFRGSRTIERYVDPNDTRIPDYAAELALNPDATPQGLDAFYRWRTLYNRTFAP